VAREPEVSQQPSLEKIATVPQGSGKELQVGVHDGGENGCESSQSTQEKCSPSDELHEMERSSNVAVIKKSSDSKVFDVKTDADKSFASVQVAYNLPAVTAEIGNINDLLDEARLLLATRDLALTDAQRKIEKLVDNSDKILTELRDLEKTRVVELKDRSSSDDTLVAKPFELASALADVADLQTRLKSQTERLKVIEAEHSACGSKADDLRGDFANIQTSIEGEISNLKKELEAGAKALAAEKTSSENLIFERDELTEAMALTEIKLQQKDVGLLDSSRNVDTLASQIAKLENDLKRAQEAVAEKDTRLAASAKINAELEAEISSLQERLSELNNSSLHRESPAKFERIPNKVLSDVVESKPLSIFGWFATVSPQPPPAPKYNWPNDGLRSLDSNDGLVGSRHLCEEITSLGRVIHNFVGYF